MHIIWTLYEYLYIIVNDKLTSIDKYLSFSVNGSDIIWTSNGIKGVYMYINCILKVFQRFIFEYFKEKLPSVFYTINLI